MTFRPHKPLRPRRRASLLAVPAAAVLALAAAPAPAFACPGADEIPTAQTLQRARTATLCLVNRERTGRGVRPLRANGKLQSAAQGHSSDMVRRKYFAHQSPSGRGFSQRIRSTGYVSGASSWALAENIAWGGNEYGTPRGIVNSWMKSSGHRYNILNGRYRELGVGIAVGLPVRRGQVSFNPDDVRGATYTTDFGARG